MKEILVFLLISVCIALHAHELTGTKLNLDDQLALLQPPPTDKAL